MISTPEIRAHANEILDIITSNPELHSQETFIDGFFTSKTITLGDCGTTGCIAGWSTFLSGQWRTYSEYAAFVHKNSIALEAAQNLGLEHGEWNSLFYDFDNESAVEKLRYIAKGEMYPD